MVARVGARGRPSQGAWSPKPGHAVAQAAVVTQAGAVDRAGAFAQARAVAQAKAIAQVDFSGGGAPQCRQPSGCLVEFNVGLLLAV